MQRNNALVSIIIPVYGTDGYLPDCIDSVWLYFCQKKKEILQPICAQYKNELQNMEFRTNLQLLDVLCSTNEKKYKTLQKQCVQTVRHLVAYHKPISKHHKQLAWIVTHELYPLYKRLVRIKYYKCHRMSKV